MTATRAALRAAVLQVIPDGTAIACHGDAERLADAIVDAVMAVDDEQGESREEWRVSIVTSIEHRRVSAQPNGSG